MTILEMNFNQPGMVGVIPRIVTMVTTDDDETIISSNYLNIFNLQGNTVYPTDVFQINYSYSPITKSGQQGIYRPSISNGVISLVNDFVDGKVSIPVINGDFVNFDGVSGQLKDGGYSPSTTASNAHVAMLLSNPFQNGLAIFADNQGTLSPLGNFASNSLNKYLVTVGDSSATGLIPNISSNDFFINGDLGIKIYAGRTTAWGGGSTSHAFTVTGLTVLSPVLCVIYSSTNAAHIISSAPGTNLLTVTFSADPGANTVVSYFATATAIT